MIISEKENPYSHRQYLTIKYGFFDYFVYMLILVLPLYHIIDQYNKNGLVQLIGLNLEFLCFVSFGLYFIYRLTKLLRYSILSENGKCIYNNWPRKTIEFYWKDVLHYKQIKHRWYEGVHGYRLRVNDKDIDLYPPTMHGDKKLKGILNSIFQEKWKDSLF